MAYRGGGIIVLITLHTLVVVLWCCADRSYAAVPHTDTFHTDVHDFYDPQHSDGSAESVHMMAGSHPSLYNRMSHSLQELEGEFIKFMATVPKLWTRPRERVHEPVIWHHGPVARGEEPSTTPTPPPGLCSAPYGIPLRETIDPCGPVHQCFIYKLDCDGVPVDPNGIFLPAHNCKVMEVRCDNSSANALGPLLPLDGCDIHSLDCSNQTVATNATDYNPDGPISRCPVLKLHCSNELWDFTVPSNASTCPNDDTHDIPCVNACAAVDEEIGGCVCSLDRMGYRCEKWRPYTCNFTLHSPTPSCKPEPHNMDSDPVCFVQSREDKVRFTYTTDCVFTNTSHINVTLAHDDAFTYWARNGSSNFAVSTAQIDSWDFKTQIRVYDFDRIGDKSGVKAQDMSAAQLTGQEPFSFDVDFSSYGNRYFAGNRLYFEVGISRDSSFPGRRIEFDRRFIDFKDVHISHYIDSSLSASVIGWIVASVLIGTFLICLCGVSISRKIQAYKARMRVKKYE